MCGSNSSDSWWAEAKRLAEEEREQKAKAAERLKDEFVSPTPASNPAHH